MVTQVKAPQAKKMSAQTLGQFIRQERTRGGLTLAALGEKLKVTPQFVSDIETGRRHPSIAVLERVATALGTPMATLWELDTRAVYGEFKQLIESSPALRLAVKQVLTDVKAARISAEDLARRIVNSNGRL